MPVLFRMWKLCFCRRSREGARRWSPRRGRTSFGTKRRPPMRWLPTGARISPVVREWVHAAREPPLCRGSGRGNKSSRPRKAVCRGEKEELCSHSPGSIKQYSPSEGSTSPQDFLLQFEDESSMEGTCTAAAFQPSIKKAGWVHHELEVSMASSWK